MKRLSLLLIIGLFLLSGLSATWNVGNIVDDFDDPTGEHFVYATVEGTFSNTATTSSKTVIRLCQEFVKDTAPAVRWILEIHNYNWDNPVEDFYSDSTATIKIKADDGTITTFSKSNSKYGTYWNIIAGQDARTLTKLLSSNKVLKFSITIEKTKYSFTVDCSGYSEVFHSVYDELKINLPSGWYTIDKDKEFYASLQQTYKSIGMTKYYAEYSYNFKDYAKCQGKEYYYSISMDSDDYKENRYPDITIYLYKLLKDDFFTYSEGFSDDTLTGFAFVVDGKTYKMKVDTSKYYWIVQDNPQTAVTAMKTAKNTSIQMSFKNAGTISFEINGKEFSEYYEKAKDIPLF